MLAQGAEIAPVVSLIGGALGLRSETVGAITAILTLLLPVLMLVSAWLARRNPNAVLSTLVHAIERSTVKGDKVRTAIEGEADDRGTTDKLDAVVGKVLAAEPPKEPPSGAGGKTVRLGIVLFTLGLLTGCTSISKEEYKSLLDAADGYYQTVNDPFNDYTKADSGLHPQSVKNRLEAGPAFKVAIEAAKDRLNGKKTFGARPGEPGAGD